MSGATSTVMASFVGNSVNILAISAPEAVDYAGHKVISGNLIGEVVDEIYDIVVSPEIGAIEQLKGKL